MTLPIDTIFVRHGQSEGNLAKRKADAGDHSAMSPEFLGRHTSSFRLTDLGRHQAKLAGEWLRGEFFKTSYGFDRYFVSEYIRAIETAGEFGLPQAKWYPKNVLTERDWGDLDRCNEEERVARFAENLKMRHVDPFFWKPPNGESFQQLTSRLDRMLDTLHRQCSDKRVILVCHGEVMWAARVVLERMSQERFKELHLSDDPRHRIHNCQIIHYTRRDPETDELADRANWMRMIRPADSPVKIFPWVKIKRPSYSNDELLELAGKVTPMFT